MKSRSTMVVEIMDTTLRDGGIVRPTGKIEYRSLTFRRPKNSSHRNCLGKSFHRRIRNGETIMRMGRETRTHRQNRDIGISR